MLPGRWIVADNEGVRFFCCMSGSHFFCRAAYFTSPPIHSLRRLLMKLRLLRFLPLALLAFAFALPICAAEDVVFADFEGADYGAWKTEGEAFGAGPTHGALPGQMAVEGFVGKGLVNSFNKGDDTLGTLTSPEFKIERRAISF